MSNTLPISLAKTTSPDITWGHHEVLGDYHHSRKYGQWVCLRRLPSGKGFRIISKNRSAPTEEEATLWKGIDARINEFVELAKAAIIDPGIDGWNVPMDRSIFSLSQIDLFAPDGFDMAFHDDHFCEDNCLWPVVRFRNWQIAESLWEP